jgi:HEAT repeat protein
VLWIFGAAAVPALIAALEDQDAEVRIFAAEALGEIGPEAKEAVPTLIAALKDPDAHVPASATYALVRIELAAVIAIIVR